MMKKMLFCICLALYNVIVVYAAPVSRDNARQKAENFFRKHGDSRQFSSIASVKNRAGFINDSPYYICVPDSGDGFVIVSGDDALPEIVGYSFDSSSDSIPLPLSAYLSSYASLVADVGRKQISEKVMYNIGMDIDIEAVSPLLSTTWGQDEPFNNLCPVYSGFRTPAGCVATAVAQIMNYYRWPVKGTGVVDDMDLSTHEYDWDNMRDSYEGKLDEKGNFVPDYNAEEANAVALLMRDFGSAVGMLYNIGGSGVAQCKVMGALFRHFGYSSSMKYRYRKLYTKEQWIKLINRELSAGRPVAYSSSRGFGESDGHSFVCDGIDVNGLLHINWGWRGSFNGYFDMDLLNPEGGDVMYTYMASIITGICPAEENEQGELTNSLTLERVVWSTQSKELQVDIYGISNFTDHIISLSPYIAILNQEGNVVHTYKPGMQTTNGEKSITPNSTLIHAVLYGGSSLPLPPGKYLARLQNGPSGERYDVGGLPETCGVTLLDDGTCLVEKDTMDYSIKVLSCEPLLTYYASQGYVNLRTCFHNSGDIAFEGDIDCEIESVESEMEGRQVTKSVASKVIAEGGRSPVYYAHSNRTFIIGATVPEKAGKYRIRFKIDEEYLDESEPFFIDIMPSPEKPMFQLTSPIQLSGGNDLRQSSSVFMNVYANYRTINAADGSKWNFLWPIYLYALREGADSSEEVVLTECLHDDDSKIVYVEDYIPYLSLLPPGTYKLYLKYFNGSTFVKLDGVSEDYSELTFNLLPPYEYYPYMTASPLVNNGHECKQYSLVDLEIPLSAAGHFNGRIAVFDDYMNIQPVASEMFAESKDTVILRAEILPGFIGNRKSSILYTTGWDDFYGDIPAVPGIMNEVEYSIVSGEDKRLKLEEPASFSYMGYFDPGDSDVLEMLVSAGPQNSFSGKLYLMSYWSYTSEKSYGSFVQPLIASPVEVNIPFGSTVKVRIPFLCSMDAKQGGYIATVFYEDNDGTRYALNPNGHDYSLNFSVRTSVGIDKFEDSKLLIGLEDRNLKISGLDYEICVSVYNAEGIRVADFTDLYGTGCELHLPESLPKGIYIIVVESENAGKLVRKISLD